MLNILVLEWVGDALQLTDERNVMMKINIEFRLIYLDSILIQMG